MTESFTSNLALPNPPVRLEKGGLGDPDFTGKSGLPKATFSARKGGWGAQIFSSPLLGGVVGGPTGCDICVPSWVWGSLGRCENCLGPAPPNFFDCLCQLLRRAQTDEDHRQTNLHDPF